MGDRGFGELFGLEGGGCLPWACNCWSEAASQGSRAGLEEGHHWKQYRGAEGRKGRVNAYNHFL